MNSYMVFDTDGHCIAKHANTDNIITQDTAVAVPDLAVYPGMDWILDNNAIRAMASAESRIRRRKLKSVKLQAAEVAYENFLAALGLPINADSSAILGTLIQMKANNVTIPFGGVQLNPAEIQGLISGLLHDVEVNGGGWKTL